MPTSNISALLLSMAFSVIVPLAGARAQSVNQCIDRCFGPIGDAPVSHVQRDFCLQKCEQSNQSSSYGAIGYSPKTGRFGWNFGRTIAEAEQSARARCAAALRESGISLNDCDSRNTWFRAPGCGWIARAGNGAYAIRTGATAAEANMKAFAECQRQGGADCSIVKDMPQCAK